MSNIIENSTFLKQGTVEFQTPLVKPKIRAGGGGISQGQQVLNNVPPPPPPPPSGILKDSLLLKDGTVDFLQPAKREKIRNGGGGVLQQQALKSIPPPPPPPPTGMLKSDN